MGCGPSKTANTEQKSQTNDSSAKPVDKKEQGFLSFKKKKVFSLLCFDQNIDQL